MNKKEIHLEMSLILEIKKVSFVPIALRAAPTLKNRVFCIYIVFFTLQNCRICLVSSIGSMLVLLVLKNAVECTSQRLKWTSGARVMICLVSSKQAGKQTSRQANMQASGQADKRTSRQADNGKALKKFIGSPPWLYEILFWQI